MSVLMSRKTEFRQKIDQGPLPVQFPRNLRPKPPWHPRRLPRENPPQPVEVVGAAADEGGAVEDASKLWLKHLLLLL
jgi:hypothetical protein